MKTHRTTLLLLVSVSLLSLLLLQLIVVAQRSTAAAVAAGRPPNVIIVMTDDQGYGDIGAHGNPIIKTPNLDRLHAESIRLTNFHVDPTCSPTRAALLTGRYSTRTGVWHTIMGRSLLFHDETTMADLFARSGYRTGIFGKWHLGDNYPMRPQDRGFQEVLIHGGGGVGQTPDYWGNDYFDDTYFRNGRPEKFTGYCTDVFFDNALKFVEQNKQQPFFLYLPLNVPHSPYNVADKYSRPYREQGVPEARARFYGMITEFDENLARLEAHLKKLNLDDNTILIFMTDNGTAAGYSGGSSSGGGAAAGTSPSGFNAGMRGIKGTIYEGGHRVPFFIRWPSGGFGGTQKAGRDISNLTAHIDVLPTLIELCRLKQPSKIKFDGQSLVPLLRRTQSTEWSADRTLFVHSQRLERPEKWRNIAVMTERWRLINGKELYDIKVDPEQRKDVSGQQAEIVAKLRTAYEGWWAELAPRFDGYGYIRIGSAQENPARLTAMDWHGGTKDADIPWDQEAIKSAPSSNGYWMIDVARSGRYEVTLRERGEEAQFPIQATSARLKLEGVDATKAITPGATGVTFSVTLKAGRTRLETWLMEERTGKSRGAFYVDARRNESRKSEGERRK